MKHALTALALSFTAITAPTLAFSFDTSSLTPTLTYPEPAPAPVTQANSGINR
ncbi:hypothetical protein [Roseovarius sp.]|uniref:hypothetical protein n=1 Tax=Roseovarius sp. TaxID=1486281 RepID=UPI003A9870F6